MSRYSAPAKHPVPLQLEALENRCLLSSAAYVTALYQDLLNRNPAPSEVDNFVTSLDFGTSPAAVAMLFTSSPEFQTNAVRSHYEMFLGRAPSNAEVGGWLAALQAGASENQVTAAFLASDEFFSAHGVAPASWLDGIYQDVLGRQADAGGLAAWTQALQDGASQQQVALDIVISSEADFRVTTAAYLDLLQRPPDPAGLAGWVTALQNGLQPSGLLAALASSGEYIQLHAPGGLNAPPDTTSNLPDPGASQPLPDPGFMPPDITFPPPPDASSGDAGPIFDPGVPDSGTTDPGFPPAPDTSWTDRCPGVPAPGVTDPWTTDPGIAPTPDTSWTNSGAPAAVDMTDYSTY